MMFWIIAAVMTALVVLVLLLPLLRRRGAAPASSDYDRAVYRDQLRELQQDSQRGLINDSEAEAARREIERRLLQTEAQVQPDAGGSGVWPRRLAVGLVVLLLPLAGLTLYLQLGTPGLPGLPLAEREPGGPTEVALLIKRLQERIDADPQDLESRLVLAQVFERSGRFAEAADSYRGVIAVIEKNGPVPGPLYAALGETLVAAANGRVEREARLAFARAIEADPANSTARYYAGLAMAQDGRAEAALRVWQELAEDSPAGSPWLPVLREQIARAAQELGIEPPAIAQPQEPGGTAPRGPSAADVEAAQEMTPEERLSFIRSMVAQLAARLESDPADPDGWLRLARAQAVLGETDKAHAALASAEAQIDALPAEAPERAALTQRLQALRASLP
jgi:cytochrome c-type biogenesis protein CcmH